VVVLIAASGEVLSRPRRPASHSARRPVSDQHLPSSEHVCEYLGVPSEQWYKTATLAENPRVSLCFIMRALFCRNGGKNSTARRIIGPRGVAETHRRVPRGEVMLSVSKNLKLTICLGGLLAPWLLASASLPAVAGALTLDTVVTLPLLPNGNQAVLRAFDISFVDAQGDGKGKSKGKGDGKSSHTYALAASALFCTTTPAATACDATAIGPASMPGVVTINTQTKAATLLAVGNFAGNCPAPAVGQSGPNGLVIIGKEIWVGDAPIHTPSCTGSITTPSSVKVLDFKGNIKQTILTGGQARADELCYNPSTNVVLIANDEPVDNFITFISTETYEVLGTIKFNGSDPNGNSILANGIEQCAYNPQDEKFYINIPATGTTASPGPGLVLRISERGSFHVEKVFTIAASTGCTGPQGLAVGPSSNTEEGTGDESDGGNQMALGCGGTNSLVINSTDGTTAATVLNEGGTDEAWYDPTANQYYFARSTAGVLGVENAGPPATAASSNNTTTAIGSHSVAADPTRDPHSKKSHVYVPIRTGILSPTATICASKGGNNTYGCVAVFDAP
jgi:hypothetical protein